MCRKRRRGNNDVRGKECRQIDLMSATSSEVPTFPMYRPKPSHHASCMGRTFAPRASPFTPHFHALKAIEAKGARVYRETELIDLSPSGLAPGRFESVLTFKVTEQPHFSLGEGTTTLHTQFFFYHTSATTQPYFRHSNLSLISNHLYVLICVPPNPQPAITCLALLNVFTS